MPQPHIPMLLRAIFASITAIITPTGVLASFDPSGTKAVFAVTADGGRIAIGTVQFTPEASGSSTFKVSLKSEAFTDHFLSMREFKCLPAAKEISCHVPYPYPHPATVGPGNFAWLEHSLLFLYKSPAEFGAKLWNGVYFEFREEGSSLVGIPSAVDLNEISAPPTDPSKPPFGKVRRHEMSTGARWIKELLIE